MPDLRTHHSSDGLSSEQIRHLDSFYESEAHPWGQSADAAVVDYVEAFRSGSVLDVGGGDGRNALFLAEKGFEVTVVDVAPRSLERLREAAEQRGLSIRAELADAADYRPPRHDNFVCTLTLHFLSDAAARRLVEKAQEATRPGGIHFVNTFTTDGPIYALSPAGRFWLAPDELHCFYADWDLLHIGRRTIETVSRDEAGQPYVQPLDELVARRPA